MKQIIFLQALLIVMIILFSMWSFNEHKLTDVVLLNFQERIQELEGF